MAKSIHAILDAASNDEIRLWFPQIRESRWPETMPMPREAFRSVRRAVQSKHQSLSPAGAAR